MVNVEPSWTTTDLKQALRKHLQPGTRLTALLNRETLLRSEETMAAAGLVSGTVLQAVVDAVPTLHCCPPCTAHELSKRRGCEFGKWLIDSPLRPDRVDHDIVAHAVQHRGIDSASEVSREIVAAMAMAAPTALKESIDYCSQRWFAKMDAAEIVVISNPGPDPMRACISALGLIDEGLAEDGSVVQINDFARCREMELSACLDVGFNFAWEYDGPLEVADPELRALTGIMAEHLHQHFQFDFKDRLICAPVIYGGYAPDDSIIGVLSGRIALNRLVAVP